jgi:bacterioferritin-associated ferredoxin
MNKIICNCKMVYTREIGMFVKKHPSSTFDDLVLFTGVSTGCGRCRGAAEELYKLFKEKLPQNRQLSIDFER